MNSEVFTLYTLPFTLSTSLFLSSTHHRLDARSERDDALRNAEEKERRDEALHLKAADNLECLYNSKTTALETSYKNLKDTKEDHIVLYEDKLYLLSKVFFFVFLQELLLQIFFPFYPGRSLSPSFFPDRGEMPKTPKFSFFY